MRTTVGLGLALAFLLAGCGAADGLKEFEDVIQVAGGGLDPTLLGTFRIDDPGHEVPRVLRLLVLRKDGTFHAEWVTDCESDPCSAVPVGGQYVQERAFPDPGRASSVVLGFFVEDEEALGGVAYYRLTLKRALVAHSPQVSLYHESRKDLAVPYFQLEHPFELWCAADADCEAQVLSPECGQVCAAGQCACR